MSELTVVETETVPFSYEDEAAVLGSVLMSPATFAEINLDTMDFYFESHQFIWRAFEELHAEHKPIDSLTVTNCLAEHGRLEGIGGPAYLTRLITAVPFAYNVEAYAATVKDRSIRRNLLSQANALAKMAYNLEANLDDVIGRAATNIVMAASGTTGAVHIKQYADKVYDEVQENAKHPKKVWGIETGVIDFDRITGGLQRGEIVLVSGESGLGKTIFVTDLAAGAADHEPGGFYEMEMQGRAILRRLISAQGWRQAQGKTPTRLYVSAMKSGEADLSEFVAAYDTIAQKNIYMSDRSDWTTTSLRADLARLKSQYGIAWFVLDYMDLLRDNIYREYHLNSAAISHNLHAIAKDLDLAGVIVHTENKQGELSGSQKVTYDADQIIFIKENSDPRLVSVLWEKFREGEERADQGFNLTRVPLFPTFGAATRRGP